MTKVVVIGSGARGHALVRALRRGGGTRQIVAIPGNPGIAREARCVPAQPSLSDAALAESPDLVVIGPEAPLAEGFADRMAQRGVPCFGPLQAAARIESSKAFAKEIMLAAGVPTPRAAVFEESAAAREHARSEGACVVKLDGLAAGKGVIVADDGAAAAAAVDELWKPGARLLIEERLRGREVSIIALCDGETVVPLPPARDHKRLLDGDRGPNTGGMGAVCPPTDATQELLDLAVQTILEPTARELARRGTPFVGALYAGLMLTEQGPRVLEFNCRLGDPETQSLMPRIEVDLLEALAAAAGGDLAGTQLGASDDAAVTVVIAGRGYPAENDTGTPITGIEAADASGALVFHAGTALHGERLVTNGGRILNVTATGQTLADARTAAYSACELISFEGMQYRRDIALERGLRAVR